MPDTQVTLDGNKLKTKKGYIEDYATGKLVLENPEEIESRQIFERRLVEEYGYTKDRIAIEYPIQKGSQRIGPADIVVFRSPDQSPDNLYIIIENKRRNRKDGIDQLKSYLTPSTATFGVWFNGQEAEYIQKIDKPPFFRTILNIPRSGERLEDIGKYRRSQLVPATNLRSIFKTIYYHLYTNSNLPRAERLSAEMIRLLFCKISDEIHNQVCEFRAGIDEPEKNVKARIQKLFTKVIKENSDVFESTEKLLLNEKSIKYVVGELQNYSLLGTDKDVVGDAFEVFIGPALRGEKGQFFTPRNLVRMCVEILNPQPREHIIDPACGSGGFLTVALEHVWNQFDENQKKTILSDEQLGAMKRELASKYFHGIDKEFDLAKVAKAYMAIVGDGKGGIYYEDSLENPDLWKPACYQNIGLMFGNFDVVLTNPPFGSKIPITDESLLRRYELGYKWKSDKSGKWSKVQGSPVTKRAPQVLFIERCLQLLRPGGRMAIVLPEGILGNVSDAWIREFIFDKAKVFAVVDCPTETFQPSTSTKTCVMFLRKKLKNESNDKDYPIFMAVAERCGHDRRGKEIYKKDESNNYIIDEKGRRILDDDFVDVVSEFQKFRKKHNVQF